MESARRIFIWGALLATLYLTFQMASESGNDVAAEVSAPMRASSTLTATPAETMATAAALPERRWQEEAAADPFRTMAWLAPARAPGFRPPPAQAPPVPYKYFGKMTEDGTPRAFLYQGDKVLVVSEGEVLGNGYRIESIAPEVVTVTYLPLKTRQAIPLGEGVPDMAESSEADETQATESQTEKPAVIDAQAISGIQAMARQLAPGMKAKGENENNQ